MTLSACLVALFAFLVGHVVADYPLQGDFLARGKNASAPIPGVPWQTILASHALIHAGFVWAIAAGFAWVAGRAVPVAMTFGLGLAVAEFAAHAAIDHFKCTGRFGVGEAAFNIDQLLHVLCKVLWVLIMLAALA